MNYYIANFGQLRFFKPNQIPISTAMYQPHFWRLGPDSNNVFLGINAPELSPAKITTHNLCGRYCKYRKKPTCPFLTDYLNYLNTVDFAKLLSDFKTTAEEVRKVNHFAGEPDIVLLVYESIDNPCSERWELKELFSKHNIDLIDFTPNYGQNRLF